MKKKGLKEKNTMEEGNEGEGKIKREPSLTRRNKSGREGREKSKQRTGSGRTKICKEKQRGEER